MAHQVKLRYFLPARKTASRSDKVVSCARNIETELDEPSLIDYILYPVKYVLYTVINILWTCFKAWFCVLIKELVTIMSAQELTFYFKIEMHWRHWLRQPDEGKYSTITHACQLSDVTNSPNFNSNESAERRYLMVCLK